jgi:DNA-binding NarL/FixJ family response regulator
VIATTVRVLIAEDHNLVRAGLRSLLEAMPSVEVVGEAGDGRQALDLIAATVPDVVLMDITMPGRNGLHSAARVRAEHPTVRVIMLSMHDSEEYVWQALQAGASGYLLKNAEPAELELAIRSVARGMSYLSPSVSGSVLSDYVRRVGSEQGSLGRLTSRQREIVQLIAEGYTNQRIAHELEISLKTVETHRAQLMNRLQIHDVPGLVRYAVRMGLVPADK